MTRREDVSEEPETEDEPQAEGGPDERRARLAKQLGRIAVAVGLDER
jgi:hypothetical protein